MLRRFGIGLIKGLLVGSLVLSALLFGLKMVAVPVWAAYLLAVGIGGLTGLVAGKPIWQQDARIEAGLKAVAGMVLGAFGLFALNKWAPAGLMAPGALASALPAKAAQAGQVVPALTGVSLAFLPALTMVLGLLFELDNTPAPEEKKEAKGGEAAPLPRARVSSETPTPEEIDELLDSSSQQSSQRRGKR